MTSYLGERFAVHVDVDDVLLARLEESARSAGRDVIRLDLSDLSGRTELAEYLAAAFRFPHETRGLDAAADLISDLEWLGSASGYLLVVEGADRCPPDVASAFAGILPNVVDRWRSQDVPFVVAIVGSNRPVMSALSAANRDMESAGRLPWAQPGTGAVDVIVHRDGSGR